MIKKIRKPSQSKVKTSAQATRSTKPNIIVNKKPKEVIKDHGSIENVNAEDIILAE